MIETTVVNYKTSLNQQERTVHEVSQEPIYYLLSAILLCKKKHHLLIMVITISSAANEQILFNLVKKQSILTDFQF